MEADGRIGGQPVEEKKSSLFLLKNYKVLTKVVQLETTYSDVMGSPFMQINAR